MKVNRKFILSVIKYVIFLGAGILLFMYAMKGIELDKFFDELMNANFFYLILTYGVLLVSHFFRAKRWDMLLKAAGYKTKTSSTFASLLVGYGFNNIVPRGGEFARATMLYRCDKIPFSAGFGTVVTDRVADFVVLLLMLGAVLLLEFDKIKMLWENLSAIQPGTVQEGIPIGKIIQYTLAGILILSVILFIVFRKKIIASAFYKKGAAFLFQMRDSLKSVLKLERPWLFLVYTILIWSCYGLMTWLPFKALSSTQDLGLYFGFLILVIGGVGFIFPSPGGTGSYHLAVIETFRAFGESPEAGQSYALIAHAMTFFMALLVGLLAYVWLERKIKKAA